MTSGFRVRLLLGLVAALWLPTVAPAADAPPLKLDRRSLAPAPDYALPRARGTVSPDRIAAAGWQHCALSFDDGPNEITPRILAILDREHVIATYFPIAATAARHPDVIRAFVASGHEIGNHSLAHRNLAKLDAAAQRADLAEANRILRGLGANPVLFRPPYAAYDARLIDSARAQGLETVLWNLDVRDWEYRDAGMLAARVQAGMGPALVVLLHATYEWTERALPQIIAAMRDHGCRFVTLSNWIAFMRAAPAVPTPTLLAAAAPAAVATPAAPPPPLFAATPSVPRDPSPMSPPPAAIVAAAPRAEPETPQPVAESAPPPVIEPPPVVLAAAEPAAAAAQPAAMTPPPAPAPAAKPTRAPAPAKPVPRMAAATSPTALTLKPARLETGRGGKTMLQIDGDGAVLQLGADADLDDIAAKLKAALERADR